MPYDQDQFVALYQQGVATFVRYFWADDIDHAFEQAQDAEEDGEIFVGVIRQSLRRAICSNKLCRDMEGVHNDQGTA